MPTQVATPIDPGFLGASIVVVVNWCEELKRLAPP
jgi:hypothetical protein